MTNFCKMIPNIVFYTSKLILKLNFNSSKNMAIFILSLYIFIYMSEKDRKEFKEK